MFELETEIANWKDALIDGGAISSDEKMELEAHLRESVSELEVKGLSEQEAFLVATNRLGHPTMLQQEFVKNNLSGRWRYRLFWMLAGFLGVKAFGGSVVAITTVVGAVMAVSGCASAVSGSTMAVLSVLLWGSALVIGFRYRHILGRSGESLPLRWIAALGVLLVLSPAIKTLGWAAQTRVVGAAWLGEATLYSAYGAFALNLCIAVICFLALWKLNDRDTLALR